MALSLMSNNGFDFFSVRKARRITGGDDILDKYMRDLDSCARLTRDQEIALGKNVQQGCYRSREVLIECNLALVVSIAKSSWFAWPLLDRIGCGNIGLMKAVDKFDPQEGTLATYARKWIWQSINREYGDTAKNVRVHEEYRQAAYRMLNVQKLLCGRLERKPSYQEMADHTKCTVERVCELLGYTEPEFYLDAPVADGGISLMYYQAGQDMDDPSVVAHERLVEEHFMSLIHMLEDPAYIDALVRRYGLGGCVPMSLSEASKDLGMTIDVFRRVEKKAKQAFRFLLESNGYHLSHLY